MAASPAGGRRIALSCCLLALAALALPAAEAREDRFTLKPAQRFSDPTAQPKIIGGVLADPQEWPATFVFSDPGGGGCTGTAIGEHAILTAAHCIDDQAQGAVELPSGERVAARCHHHPDYSGSVDVATPGWELQASPDFALCVTEGPILQVEFERVNAEANLIAGAAALHLLGFGCNEEGGSDGGFGVLYEGDADVVALPSDGSYYVTTRGGAALCYGDSGGGAYLFLRPPSRLTRVLVGVNSRGDLQKVSLISSTSEQGFLAWARSLAQEQRLRICGLHETATGCRPL